MQALARRGTDAERSLLRAYHCERNRPFHGSVSDRSRADFRELVFGEVRGDSTAATSLGSVTPPTFLLQEWQKWRTAAAPAASRARSRPLPPTGMEVEIPGLTSGIAVAEQTGENLVVDASTVTSKYAVASVVTLVGQVAAAQQLLDRSGVSFDEIVAEQCAERPPRPSTAWS